MLHNVSRLGFDPAAGIVFAGKTAPQISFIKNFEKRLKFSAFVSDTICEAPCGGKHYAWRVCFMDDYEEEYRPRRWWLFIVIPLAVATLVAGGIWAGKTFFSEKADKEEPGYKSALEAAMAGEAIGYAANVVTSDPETLQDAVDAMFEKATSDPGVSLEYKDTAFSSDGRTFECYIGNSAKNVYDMFITIYGDPEMTDILFLSELLRPGTRFEEITLERQLEPGVHEAYLVHTQVTENKEDETALQLIQAQIATTFTLVVE